MPLFKKSRQILFGNIAIHHVFTILLRCFQIKYKRNVMTKYLVSIYSRTSLSQTRLSQTTRYLEQIPISSRFPIWYRNSKSGYLKVQLCRTNFNFLCEFKMGGLDCIYIYQFVHFNLLNIAQYKPGSKKRN